jgi:predicted transcriptional regulator
LKVAVGNPKQVIEDLAKAIRTLASSSSDQRAAMSRAALAAARRETWDQRARLIAGWYHEIATPEK